MLNSLDNGNIAKATGSTTLQTPPETCSLCNNSVSLYKPNGANLKPITKLICVHIFHLKLFTQLSDPENEKVENSSTPQIDFPKIHDKILKALEDKLAELKSKNPLCSAQIMLNKEIRYQFLSDTTRNIFNKKKHSALNIYRIFSSEDIGRDKIQQIRSFTLSSIGKFTDNEIKIIKERSKKILTSHSEKQTNEGEESEYNTDMEID
ncbi:14201_t:CDS:2 [Ambispora leptoticha]|uniref:14201_t:CDS:1 n=1 Tax=Ambispora leptoticha TaxID=144679 RepID=A0A9N8WB06_9GLOM|nr:14201_t:CDS:2 [Ambispora leptoticha]